jgi:hypothetical protein
VKLLLRLPQVSHQQIVRREPAFAASTAVEAAVALTAATWGVVAARRTERKPSGEVQHVETYTSTPTILRRDTGDVIRHLRLCSFLFG